MTTAKSLIINSPYAVPSRYWAQAHDGTLSLVVQRRPAGYEIFDVRNNTRRTEPLELVNEIRQRVDAWRAADCPGITSVTRGLIEHWYDQTARTLPFYFCQIEAIETLISLRPEESIDTFHHGWGAPRNGDARNHYPEN